MCGCFGPRLLTFIQKRFATGIGAV